MIEIRIKTHDLEGRPITESSFDIQGEVKLADIAMTLLELEKIKEKLLKESDDYSPEVRITK